LPSQPPVLPGFSAINILGSGGFADVFLYEQNMPRRQVAVKVLLSEVVDDHVRRMFQAEANLMAQLSSHPSILTVYQAGVSSDGRPYLVMELCSAALSARYRRERIPVAEVLRVAVKIGSAIETAHRAGVLHRDIKPSNILLTAYGHPVLSDFGIASTVSEVHSTESVGLSIPWSAPEVLSDETAGTISSEVWSFAATVYSLLAGRSPFEMAGEPNKTAELTSRILRARVQPTGRSDVPPTLERALARAMSRKPEARQESVLELVRELQAIESELGLPQTAIEVAMDEWARPSVSDLEERTRIRGAVGAPSAPGNRRRKRTAGQDPRADSGPLRPNTSAAGAPSGVRTSKPGRPALGWIVALIVGFVIVIVLGVAATIVLVRSSSQGIPQVAAIQASAGTASVRFTWSDPGLTSHDSYQITTGDGVSVQTATDFTQDAVAGDRVCITVSVTRGGKTGAPREKCLNFGG
jgi:serine/threonine protein kinase